MTSDELTLTQQPNMASIGCLVWDYLKTQKQSLKLIPHILLTHISKLLSQQKKKTQNWKILFGL